MTSPTRQITDIVASSIKPTQATLSWTNGNGEKHIVFVKEGAGAITNPINDTTYTASADWNSKGKQLGTSGYYCVYNGTGDTVTITNLPLHTTFTVQAFEYNGNAGNELYLTTTSTGNPASFSTNKADPVITWSNPADIVYGTLLSGVQLNATADVPGTFAYNPVTSTLFNAGSNQPLITEFSPVDTAHTNSISDTVYININKAVLTVTADDKSRETGIDNPAFTVSYDGFVNSETESVIDTKPIATCSATAASPAGDYDIIVSGGSDNNYSFTYINGKLTVTPLSEIESTENTLHIYPNPVTDKLVIKSNRLISRISVTDCLGREKLNIQVNSEFSELSFTDYEKGIWFLSISFGKQISIYKIIKY